MKLFTGPYLLLLLLLALCALPVPAAQEGELGAAMVNPGYEEKPAWFKLSFLDLREDVADARAAGKRVMLYFYQDGCPYCAKLLQDNFSQREIVDKTRQNFEVIAINMWGDREVTDLEGNTVPEKEFAANLRVMFTPTLLFLDEQGQVILRINGYYFPARFDIALDYAAEKMEQQLRFSSYLQQRAPVQASGKLHMEPWYLQPPHDLSKRGPGGKKYLLVLFEQKQCKACDEMHLDIFRRPETREELQHFDVMLVDMHGNQELTLADGRVVTASRWARELDIRFAPSMVFFDADGREVFRTEAYLKAFHQQSAMAYVHSGAYRQQPNFQRFLQARSDEMRARGIEVDIMK